MVKLDILAIGAHPDDVELSCSGTLLKAASQGKKIGIVDLTQGELGTRGSGPLRLKEAEASAKVLGLSARLNLGLPDGFFIEDKEQLLKLIHAIRLFQPSIILANALSDRHPDHGRGASFISRACFLSGLRKIETTEEGQIQESWRPQVIYHYIQDHHLNPDFVVDVTDFMDKKMESIKCFRSQFFDPSSSEPASPISTENFLDVIKAKGRIFGRSIEADFAEGFNVARPIGVEDLFDLS